MEISHDTKLPRTFISRRTGGLKIAQRELYRNVSFRAVSLQVQPCDPVMSTILRFWLFLEYKSTLQFLPCDAMHSAAIAGMRCPSRLPVRPSYTFVSCAKTTKDIFEIFSPSGSQAILVFPYQTGWRYSDGNPPNGGVECKGVWKNDDFRPISRSISETVIVRWAYAARKFVSIELYFHPHNI